MNLVINDSWKKMFSCCVKNDGRRERNICGNFFNSSILNQYIAINDFSFVDNPGVFDNVCFQS